MSEVAAAPEQVEESPAPGAAPGPILFSVTVAGVAWAAATAVFLLLRVAALLTLPVGGPEVIHLAGAWQASIGVADERFVPTLFQALSALAFESTTSQAWPRALALLATATVPGAVWLLRPVLGNEGALVALLLLALDPIGLWFGASASAMGFDGAVSAWLLVLLIRGGEPAPVFALAGFAVAVSGPLPLSLAAGWAVVALLLRERLDVPKLGNAAGGAAIGILLANAGFGYGFDDMVVPPFDLFAAGFDEDWSTATTADLLALYAWPIVLPGIAAAGFTLWQRANGEQVERWRLILVGWLGVGVAWFVASAASEQAVPLLALTMPSALLLGPLLPRVALAMVNADWRWARYLLPLAGAAALLGLAIVVDWASDGEVGGLRDQALAVTWALIGIAALVMVGSQRESRPALAAAGFVVAALALLPGTLNVALSPDDEPLPSPVSPHQARVLRNAAMELAEVEGGTIVVHPDFEKQITWPFRDSGKIVVASRVPLDAAVVIWPADAPRPDGLTAVEGNWSLRRDIEAPTGGLLDYLGWFIDRNSAEVRSGGVAVYSKASQ